MSDISFSQFWRLEIARSRYWPVQLLVRVLFLAGSCLLTVASHDCVLISESPGLSSSFFFFNSLLLFLFVCLFVCLIMAVLGLRFCARTFSSCGKGGHSSSRCAGLPPSRPLLLWSTGSRRAGSVIVAHGPSRSTARGILPDQGLNPCPLHWQADSQPPRHQGSPLLFLYSFQSHYGGVTLMT